MFLKICFLSLNIKKGAGKKKGFPVSRILFPRLLPGVAIIYLASVLPLRSEHSTRVYCDKRRTPCTNLHPVRFTLPLVSPPKR